MRVGYCTDEIMTKKGIIFSKYCIFRNRRYILDLKYQQQKAIDNEAKY